jgi:hypothetical protein
MTLAASFVRLSEYEKPQVVGDSYYEVLQSNFSPGACASADVNSGCGPKTAAGSTEWSRRFSRACANDGH